MYFMMVCGVPLSLVCRRILPWKNLTRSPAGVQAATLEHCRLASTASLSTQGKDGAKSTAPPPAASSAPSELPLHSHLIPDYQEWYIPVTRRSLIGKLLADDQFGGGSEKTRRNLKIVAAEIDVAVANKYHKVWRG